MPSATPRFRALSGLSKPDREVQNTAKLMVHDSFSREGLSREHQKRGPLQPLRVHSWVTFSALWHGGGIMEALIYVCACSCINTAAQRVIRNMKDDIPAFSEM